MLPRLKFPTQTPRLPPITRCQRVYSPLARNLFAGRVGGRRNSEFSLLRTAAEIALTNKRGWEITPAPYSV
jgi:hypothetical protein